MKVSEDVDLLYARICELLDDVNTEESTLNRLIYMWERGIAYDDAFHFANGEEESFFRWASGYGYYQYVGDWSPAAALVTRQWPDVDWSVDYEARNKTFVARRRGGSISDDSINKSTGRTAQLALLRLLFNRNA